MNQLKNDFAAVCGFTDEPIIIEECISSFIFEDDFINKNNGSSTTLSRNSITTSESAPTKTIDFNTSSTSTPQSNLIYIHNVSIFCLKYA